MLLKQKAQQAREDVKEMEKFYTQQKIETLEQKLETQKKLSTSDKQDIQNKIDSLKRFLDRSLVSQPKEEEKGEVDFESFLKEKSKTLKETLEAQPNLLASEKQAIQDEIDSLKPLSDNEEKRNEYFEQFEGERPQEDNFPNDSREIMQELSEEEIQTVAEFKSVFNEVQDVFNITSVAMDGYVVDDLDFEEINKEFDEIFAGNVTKEEVEMMKDATKVVNFVSGIFGKKKIEDFKKDFAEQMQEANEMMKTDPLYLEKIEATQNKFAAFPDKGKVSQSDVDVLYQNVLLKTQDVFKMASKPTRTGGFYIVRGKPLEDDGNKLISRIDQEIASNATLNGKIKVFYIRDPTQMVELFEDDDLVALSDALQGGSENPLDMANNIAYNLQSPALLVVSSDTINAVGTEDFKDSSSLRASLTLAAVLSTAIFSANCYGDEGLTTTSPSLLLIGGLLSLNLVHEIGHFAVAAWNKLEYAYLPCLLPAPDTGILTTFNRLRTPAKSNKEVFDFAFTGPLGGFIASWSMLVYGLQQTSLYTNNDAIAALPHVPLDFLQLSPLTSATAESVLGIDVLLSLDPTSSNGVAVHPWVIAGHIGILINALEMLPTGPRSSDGMRMLRAVLPSPRAEAYALDVGLYLCLIYTAWVTRDISMSMFAYIFLGFFEQKKDDIIPRNDVDTAGPLRLAIFAVSTLVACISLGF